MADLIMLKFDETYGAQRALTAALALEELRYAWIDDIAVVEKHKTGLVSLHTPHGSVTRGALWGGLIGLLVFWWFPPAWFLGAWVGGIGGGALIGEAMKRSGIDEKLIHEVRSELTPGTSALLLLGVSGDVDQMQRAFEQYRPVKVIRRAISEDVVESLKEAFAEEIAEETKESKKAVPHT